MKKNWVPFILLGVFLFWVAPEIFSNHLSEDSTPSRIVVEHRILGVAAGRSVYGRDAVQTIEIRYQKAYFDLKMRGLYYVGLKLKTGKFVILKVLSTTHQYELSLAYAPDLQIKHNQALEHARKIAAKLNLALSDASQNDRSGK